MNENELYRRHRPDKLEDVVGQKAVIAVLEHKLLNNNMPHVVLFAGPSGVGKTTLARIVASVLGASGSDLQEINCADVRGIDTVREIRDTMGYAPLGGKARAWILDEVIQLPKATQQAFLKVLEDTPSHAYFLMCASDLANLIPTFLGRCFILTLESLTDNQVCQILDNVITKEGINLSREIKLAIVSKAQGSGRRALQMLDAATTVETDEEKLECIGAAGVGEEEKLEFLAKALLRKAPWPGVLKIVSTFKDHDVEGVRRQVLSYMTKVLLNPKVSEQSMRARAIIRAFQDQAYMNGVAGVVTTCFELLCVKEE